MTGYEHEIVSEEVREWILEEADVRTSEEDPWTSKNELRQQVVKTDLDVDAFKETVRALIERDHLFSWHGLLALQTEESLRAVIENETGTGYTRMILVGKANRALEEVGE